jgi:hypothetical protein
MTLDDRLKRAVDTLGDRLREEITRELRVVTEELSARAQAEREAAVQSARAQESDGKRILDSIRAMDEARSVTAALDMLVARAKAEASRAGVLLVRGDRIRGWRDDSLLDVPISETRLVAEAVRTGLAASTTATGTVAPPFAGAPPAAALHAFPLSLSGDVVAVLYGEGGNADTLEILARHAARVLESLTAFKTARAVAGVASVDEPHAGDMPAAGDEEVAAQRYARLLISEIKLYHEDAVEAGRRERDLSVRLAGEIARARSLYEERVPAHVPHAADHFREELVRTLAGGDASLLVDVSAA